ncbi:MAG: helicase [Bacteroidaceae bacterium]|nr:helicase [Bacteroidaceae bacterium]
MGSNFFTNEDQNTLLNKIEGVFQYKKVHFFDALVGYFRASGYFRIRKFIQQTPKIRFLVGINVDKLTYIASQQGLLFSPDASTSLDEFFSDIKQNIQEAQYDKDVEEGMYQFIEDIATGRIEMRIHPKQNIHAKIYIFREETYHPHGFGSVITGSSNLTEAGLEKNFEFNVELRNDDDILFATETFERLWEESVPIALQYVEKLKQETYLNTEFTPYEVYLKFLLEYFGNSINFDPNSVSDLPKGYKKLSYQIDAVNDGYAKMMKHNGFFLSDVVGLGKTIVAALIAKKFFFSNGFPTHRSHTLVIVPPALQESWEDTLSNFKIDNYKIITNGSLHKIKDASLYDLVIVDEAHKFRTDTASMYNELQKICKTPTRRQLPNGSYCAKKVILISATPLNNRPEDIANLVYLFQDSKDSTLEEGNLQRFFREQIDKYRKVKDEDDMELVSQGVKSVYEKIRVKVVEPLTVRRTRTDLMTNEAYKKDLEEQGVVFPNVQAPKKIYYPLDDKLNELYDWTIKMLSDKKEGLTYFRYQAIKYLSPEKKKKYKKADMISQQLATIMKTLLVKRIDSSFFAFKQSLKRYYEANSVMLQMFDKGTIYIAPNLKVTELLSNGKEDELIKLINESIYADPTIEICTPADFENGFLEGIEHDGLILKDLVKRWDEINYDPKLDIFLEYLDNILFDKDLNNEGKLVVFSESKETTDYLLNTLKQHGYSRTIAVKSSNRNEMMPLVRANFDANHEGPKKNDIDIIISTEVLAEGVNLHRANVIVNYDTPWNSTRLMQRIGRVNRIGSTAQDVYIFNFFPTQKVNDDIELEKKAKMKLFAFHAALGEDSQIYSTDESPETFGLFDKDIDEERDEKLVYLMRLRKLKEEEPDLIRRISRMPMRSRVGRKSKVMRGSTLVFIRNNRRDAFTFVREDGTHEDLTFLEAAKAFEARMEEKAIPLHDKHHWQVALAISAFSEKEEDSKAISMKVNVAQGPNEKRAIAYLDACLHVDNLTEQEAELIRQAKRAITSGKFQQLQRDVNKLQSSTKKTPVKPAVLIEKMISIISAYPLLNTIEDTMQPVAAKPKPNKEITPEIIISESFDS